MLKQKVVIIGSLLFSIKFFAQQEIKKDTVTRKAEISYYIKNNELTLTPKTPELIQIAGAPKAYYSYFWELGDGKYSKEKEPKHVYKEKGDYEVKLWVTNHYDNGKPPATRPQKVSVKETIQTQIQSTVASMNDDLELEVNRDPVPEEEMVLVMRYKNLKNYVTNGRLYLFYNERKYKNNNFEVLDIRPYHNEEQINEEEKDVVLSSIIDDNPILYSALDADIEMYEQQIQDSTRTDLDKTLKQSKEYYKSWSIFNFNDLDPSEERNLFFTLKTPPEMLKDTSAIISIRGVYVPDVNFKNHTVKEKEMEIVTSHDPNKMSSNGTLLNYRLVRFKTLKYKVQFQNDGEGPARTVKLETDIPKMLDKKTLKVLDMYPKCEICPKEEVNYSCLDTTFIDKQVVFTFKNIYLPGTNQKGVKDKDSTKGFVKYSIKFGKDFHKKKTVSKTSIIFDKNDPIITNISTTRFSPGISIGAKAGYNYYPKLNNSKDYFVGATLSPFKSYRWYWQVEMLNSLHTYNSDSNFSEVIEPSAQGVDIITRTTNVSEFSNVDLEIPLLVRYNVNNYIGLGAGIQGKLSLSKKTTNNSLVENYEKFFLDNREVFIGSKTTVEESSESFTNFRKGLLFEVTGGFARIGPSVGARYVLDTEKNNYWQFYLIWKF